MIDRIAKMCMVFLYGKCVLDGYYSDKKSKKEEKNYVFSSVFPSQASMEVALEQSPMEV